MRGLFSFLFLALVIYIGEMSKDPDAKFPKIDARPEQPAPLPPLPELSAEGDGVLVPPSSRDPVIEIADDAKSSRSQYTGTAFSIDNRGLWVTARHVTHGCDQLVLLRPHRRALKVEAVSEHRRADVAILQTEGGYDAFPVNYDIPEYNQQGFHFGYPRGEPGDVYSNLIGRRTIKTTGTRNNKEAVLVWAEKIRVPDSYKSLGGISGGPILNESGEVVGIHVAGSVRRGRSFSSLPRTITQLLDQSDVDLKNANKSFDVSQLNAEEFSSLGDQLRSDLSVAQVVCRTN